ncbi:hypothetical protein [Micromonospora sp. NBC_01638]|nr:hypothetical protein OG811_30925 [Micromonospora sp. NBC_01638]
MAIASYPAGDVPGQVRVLAPSGVDGLIDLVGRNIDPHQPGDAAAGVW